MRFSILAGLLAPAAVSCSSPTAPAVLATRVAVERTTLRVGDTLAVRVSAVNRGARAAIIVSACTGPVARLFDAAGVRADHSFCPIPEATEMHLAPGDSLVATYSFPMSRPGAFVVVGGFDGVGGDLLARSAPVAIDVVVP